MLYGAAAVIVLGLGCGGVFLANPPFPLVFTLPAGFVLALMAHASTATEENLQRKANIGFFIIAVMVLMIFMGYVPLVWKLHGWTQPLRIAHVASNVAVQVLLFLAFFRQPYRRTERKDGGGKA